MNQITVNIFNQDVTLVYDNTSQCYKGFLSKQFYLRFDLTDSYYNNAFLGWPSTKSKIYNDLNNLGLAGDLNINDADDVFKQKVVNIFNAIYNSAAYSYTDIGQYYNLNSDISSMELPYTDPDHYLLEVGLPSGVKPLVYNGMSSSDRSGSSDVDWRLSYCSAAGDASTISATTLSGTITGTVSNGANVVLDVFPTVNNNSIWYPVNGVGYGNILLDVVTINKVIDINIFGDNVTLSEENGVYKGFLSKQFYLNFDLTADYGSDWQTKKAGVINSVNDESILPANSTDDAVKAFILGSLNSHYSSLHTNDKYVDISPYSNNDDLSSVALPYIDPENYLLEVGLPSGVKPLFRGSERPGSPSDVEWRLSYCMTAGAKTSIYSTVTSGSITSVQDNGSIISRVLVIDPSIDNAGHDGNSDGSIWYLVNGVEVSGTYYLVGNILLNTKTFNNNLPSGTISISGLVNGEVYNGKQLTADLSSLSDSDGHSLTYTYSWQYSLTSDGIYTQIVTTNTYTPTQAYVDNFIKLIVTVNDGFDTAIFNTSPLIINKNNAPTVSDTIPNLTTDEDVEHKYYLSQNIGASDQDGDPFTYSIVTGTGYGPSKGNAVIEQDSAENGGAFYLKYTPTANENGSDSVMNKSN